MTGPADAAEEPEEPGAPDATAAEEKAGAGPAESAAHADAPVDGEQSAATTDAAEEDFEGPRRRARREREERRAAQARAIAIEQNRREAKRRVSGRAVEAPAPRRRGVIRGLKVLMWSALIAVLAVGAGLLLYFTPVMSARETVIIGLAAIAEDEIRQAAAVPAGTPLLQIDTDAVAERVASIRRVASVRVQREYPSTLRITVQERIPLVVKDYPDGPHLFDKDGVDFVTAPPPPGLPYIDTESPGPNDPATDAALEVLTALPPEVSGQVSRVEAPSVAAITLILFDGRKVVWGTTDRTEEKALKLAALLTQPGQTYDVSSPDLPTVK
ncbi:cell division protein FtsQ [Mycobacterium adipatum]|jgi:cell division protein FtsQ|uniref:Cell division protein FtsQ n=1 Tax=Mycobacterium adipatum TaxID=1682113 RepID=A0A172UMZ9_9MYCO|nr:cell division protein FtsQ/DivIB [Mycobacterium adipatum]ANE80240.1 cell division protein FtsQ [Mycobacterium adipatum]MBI5737965.1 cell division protein FtsQ/DivIB [Mycolicibacterium neoaurum]